MFDRTIIFKLQYEFAIKTINSHLEWKVRYVCKVQLQINDLKVT